MATEILAPKSGLQAHPVRLSLWRQYVLLFRIQYSEYRDSAVVLALFSMLMPLGMLWLMGGYVSAAGSTSTWFLAGNAVMSVSFGSANFAVVRVGQLRLQHEMDYYATLPVTKGVFLLTLFSLSQISALPGLLSSVIAGHWLLGVPFANIIMGLPLAFLAAICLTVVGAAAGAHARTWGQLNLYGTAIYFVVLFLSPVLVSLERMPSPIRYIALLLPTGQATLALTDAFAGDFDQTFWLFTALLFLWIVAAGTYGFKKLDLRGE